MPDMIYFLLLNQHFFPQTRLSGKTCSLGCGLKKMRLRCEQELVQHARVVGSLISPRHLWKKKRIVAPQHNWKKGLGSSVRTQRFRIEISLDKKSRTRHATSYSRFYFFSLLSRSFKCRLKEERICEASSVKFSFHPWLSIVQKSAVWLIDEDVPQRENGHLWNWEKINQEMLETIFEENGYLFLFFVFWEKTTKITK